MNECGSDVGGDVWWRAHGGDALDRLAVEMMLEVCAGKGSWAAVLKVFSA